jgi:hypothetical protein
MQEMKQLKAIYDNPFVNFAFTFCVERLPIDLGQIVSLRHAYAPEVDSLRLRLYRLLCGGGYAPPFRWAKGFWATPVAGA